MQEPSWWQTQSSIESTQVRFRAGNADGMGDPEGHSPAAGYTTPPLIPLLPAHLGSVFVSGI
jgi:hypothetical protein